MADYAHEMEKDGFIVRLELLPEYEVPDWDFESEDERQELLRKIDQGVYLWFCAKVSVWKADIELGADYLGGCCYDSVEQFIKDGYFKDMVDNAINYAQQKLIDLAA